MRRRTSIPLLLLAAGVAAQPELTLGNLFDPACPSFGLRILSPSEFAGLRRSRQLIARGVDPRRWREPPREPDSIVQANNARSRLRAGFGYAERLRAKQKAFDRLVRRVPAEDLIGWMPQLTTPPPEEFARRHFSLFRGMQAGRKFFAHPLNALRHSERQFHGWFLDELAGRIRALPSRRRAGPVRLLRKELRRKEAARRIHAARVLGGVDHPLAARALEQAIAVERDPEVIGALVHARARLGGPRFHDLSVLWARDARPALRGAVLRAWRTMGGRRARALLRDRVGEETGRLRDDILEALGGESDGPIDFYGIRTNSKRIVFCVDISGSMLFPMDGEGGKLEPRIWRTRREISRTLETLPDDVHFNVLLFADRVVPWKPGLTRGGRDAAQAAIEWIGAAKALGGTNLLAALAAASGSGADTVFLLTDGEPSVGRMIDPDLVMEEVAAHDAHGRVVIHTIGLSRDQNAVLLVNLAARTGGRYVADR